MRLEGEFDLYIRKIQIVMIKAEIGCLWGLRLNIAKDRNLDNIDSLYHFFLVNQT